MSAASPAVNIIVPHAKFECSFLPLPSFILPYFENAIYMDNKNINKPNIR